MASSPASFSSILHAPNSNIANSDVGFNKIRFWIQKKQAFADSPNPISLRDSCPSSSSSSCNSTAIFNSLSLDHDCINDEELHKAESRIGSKIRVNVDHLKVYHVPKLPELELSGRVGFLKQYVGIHKGKRVSANLPYKVEFAAEEVGGGGGKPVKFFVHLRGDEFEFLE